VEEDDRKRREQPKQIQHRHAVLLMFQQNL
jgi:hypothetical protein